MVSLLVVTSLVACAPAADRCFPAQLEASPILVSPGDPVTIESGPVTCDLGYADGTTYSVLLISPSGERSDETEVPVDDKGSFAAEIVVPESFPAGPATAVVQGSAYDDCYSDGGSCASYSVELEIRPEGDSE